MFTAALFIVALSFKQTEWPSAGKLMNTLWPIYTMEYYSGIKRNGLLIYTTMWRNHKDIILNERSQTPKSIYYTVRFIGNFAMGKINL